MWQTKPEPTRAEQSRPEPTRAEQTRPEPTRAEQTRPEPTQDGADETGAHQGGADETGAHQGRADETGAHQGGADETGAHQGGADRAGDLHNGAGAFQGGAEIPGRDWDLEETETQEAERAYLVSGTEARQVHNRGNTKVGAGGRQRGYQKAGRVKKAGSKRSETNKQSR